MIMSVLFSCFLGSERRSSTAHSNESESSSGAIRDGSTQAEIVYVELLKQNNEPLGLMLEGGTDHDLPVRVSHLRPGGVAYSSGALQIGDRVLSINGTVTDRLTHSEVIALLENSGNIVNLEIAFEPDGSPKLDDGMGLKTALIAISCDDTAIFPGFVISGGRLENRQLTVSHVKEGSYAYKKGILRAGDRILQVNHVDMRNASRSEADQLLVPCENGCSLQIEYDVSIHEGLESTSGPLIVELQKPHGASLGISLSDDRVPGEPIMISKVREAGIADRSGVLHFGDRLLSINGQPLYSLSVQEARHLLNHSGITVKLEVMLAHHFSDRPGFSPIEDALSDVSSRASQSASVSGTAENQRRPSQLSLTSANSSNQVLSHPEVMTISLSADPIGFGMEIEGGTDEYSSYPVVISEIIPNGPAALLGRLMVGDRILSINGESLTDVSLNHASKLIKEADDTLQMEVEFDVTDSSVVPTSGTFEVTLVKSGCLNLGISIRTGKVPSDKIWIADIKKGGIACRSGALQAGDILLAINGVSVVGATIKAAASLLTDSSDKMSLNIRRESVNNFMPSRPAQAKSTPVIYAVELTRNGETLGISLDGSEQPGQPIVISEIREGGVAYRTGAIKVGDRIIAINGESLLTKTIQDAFRILQTAGNTVTLKISKGVVRGRRQRQRMASNRYYKTRYNSRLRGSRVPSRISHTSESELSTSFTSLEGSLPHLVNSRHHRPDMGRRVTNPPNHTYSNGALPGRYSPNNRSRHGSAGQRGRSSPAKERTSPNRDRNAAPKTVGGIDSVNFRRGSLTETTDEETLYDEHPWQQYKKQLNSSSNGGAQSVRSPLAENTNGLQYPWSGKGSPSQVAPSPSGGAEGNTLEDNILETICRSKGFTRKLHHLAHSNSSAEESDQEPPGLLLRDMRLPPHVHLLDPLNGQQYRSEELLKFTVVRREGFGFSLSDGLNEPGVYINQINPEGPAADSGLQSFDRIMEINGVSVRDYDCCKVKPLFSQTDIVTLTVSRNHLINGAAANSLPPSLRAYPSSAADDILMQQQP